MANELTYQLRLGLVNGNLTDAFASGSLRGDQDTARLIRNTQPIGNTEEQIDPGDLVTPGWAMFANISETDTDEIEVGSYVGGTFYPFLLVKQGEYQMCRIGVSTAELYAKSNNAAGVILFYIIYND